MPGFHVSSLPNCTYSPPEFIQNILLRVWTVPLVTPTSSPIIPTPRKQEVVLFVGYPCLGKTSFFKRYFRSENYLHINQDTLKSRDKCVKAVKNALESGHSCVIGLLHSIILFVLWLNSTDNTNRDAATRKAYLDLCRAHNISARYVSCSQYLKPITFFCFRCFVFTGSIELAWHNNLYRAFNLPPSVAANEVSDAD